MGRYNLLDEPWIEVLTGEGKNEKVSMKDVFRKAHQYRGLAGDMETQDFAVLRVLLAVLHTVFSRVNAEGKPYAELPLGERYTPSKEVTEEDRNDYEDALFDTWCDIWEKGSFPAVVEEYLEAWRDRFYLFDDKYPFYQVTKEVIDKKNLNKDKPGTIFGKNMNRLISESGNKVALFSPKSDHSNEKDILSADEIMRWLLTYQGYSGLPEKVIFGKTKYKASKGWLFDIGGVYTGGRNLFETLWLNCALLHPEEAYRTTRQRPCWEETGNEVVQKYLKEEAIDNLAELYTNWSRAVYIDPETDEKSIFSFQTVKLPQIEHSNQFLEPMTLWRFNESGENKDQFTPRKHKPEESFWRSFGLLTLPHGGENGKNPQRRPGLMEWLQQIKSEVEEKIIVFSAVTMKDDGNRTSWVPVDEVCDELRLPYNVLTDDIWLPRINDAVEETKDVIDHIYGYFLKEIQDIRGERKQKKEVEGLVEREKKKLYFAIDDPFRRWMSRLQPEENKEEALRTWRHVLKRKVEEAAHGLLQTAGNRDYQGVADEKTGTRNIATAYERLIMRLHSKLP